MADLPILDPEASAWNRRGFGSGRRGCMATAGRGFLRRKQPAKPLQARFPAAILCAIMWMRGLALFRESAAMLSLQDESGFARR